MYPYAEVVVEDFPLGM